MHAAWVESVAVKLPWGEMNSHEAQPVVIPNLFFSSEPPTSMSTSPLIFIPCGLMQIWSLLVLLYNPPYDYLMTKSQGCNVSL